MSRRGLFLLAYACSGLAGLVYEVCWARLLGLELGHAGEAAATVLGAYMGGLAVGALLAGPVASRLGSRSALRAYAGLELLVAACAIAIPIGLIAARPLLGSLYGADGGGSAFALVRLAVCLGLIGVPTAALGATFPIAARGFLRAGRESGAQLATLYAVNTAGAALGALGAGFVLLPQVGLRSATWVAASFSLAAAAVAWWLASRESDVPDVGSPGPEAAGARGGAAARRARRPRTRDVAPIDPPRRFVAAAAIAVAFTGMAALASQLAWTRVLALIVGPTSYAFGAMLATFIAGLAVGAAAGAALARHARFPALWLAVSAASAGCAVIGVAPVVNRLPLVIAEAASVAAPGQLYIVGPLVTALAAIVPMAVGFGACLPLAFAVAAGHRERAPRIAAVLVAANTVGAVAGSIGTGFALLPALGIERSFDVVAVFAAAGAVAAALAIPGRLRLASFGLAVLPVVAAWAGPVWDRDLLFGGAYKYGRYVDGIDAESALRAGTWLFRAEGRVGAVSVRRTAGVVALAIDGKVDASSGGDMLTQQLLAHLPLLLHPDPRKVAIVGLGSGVTLGAALQHPLERADVVELAPEVVRAAAYFDAWHHGALGDPRTRLIVGDGRTHLRLTRQRYDVIVSEPSNPWIAGMAALFTREFFLAARARLADGGLMCQWAHAYDMREADLRSIVATFVSVFPGATLWLVGESDVLLVGGLSPVEVSAPEVEARWASRNVATHLGAVRVSRPFSILSLLAADGDGLTRYVSGAPLQTDDRLALEYSGPAAVFRGARVDLAATFEPDGWVEGRVGPARAVVRSATSEDWVDRGRMLLAAEAPRRAFESFSRAVELAPGLRQAVSGLVDSAPAGGHLARATDQLARIVRRDPGQVTARIGYSRLLAASGRLQEAIDEARLAAEGDPDSVEALEHWAGLLGDTQQAAALGDVVVRLVRLRPDSAETAYYAGTQAFLEGRVDAALASARRATAADPGHARAWGLAGAALAALGRLDEAREAFGSAVAADPRDPTAYANLGLVALNGGSLGDAARWFAESLAADAGYRPAREGLATTLERIGEVDRASRLRRGGR